MNIDVGQTIEIHNLHLVHDDNKLIIGLVNVPVIIEPNKNSFNLNRSQIEFSRNCRVSGILLNGHFELYDDWV